MDDSKVIVTLKLVGGQSFSSAAREAGVALSRVGAAGDAAGAGLAKAGAAGTVASTRLGRAHLAATRLGAAMRTVGKGVGVAGAAVGVATLGFAEFAKTAVEKVQSLAETASALHNIAGLSASAGIQLAAVAQATGVKSKQLGMSLKALATQATNAEKGNKASVKTFGLLGISLAQVKATGGNLTKLLSLVAGGLERTRGGAGKLTAASKLLGRGWMGLNPILEGGGRELRSLTRFAASLGITLSGNTARNLAKARDASYRWKLVMTATQLFVVNKLVPALLQMAAWINKNVVPAVKDIAKWMQRFHSTLIPIAGAVAAAFVVSKIASFGSAILALVASTGPIGLLVAGLGAAVALANVLNQTIRLAAGSTPNQVSNALHKAGAPQAAINDIINKLNNQGAFPTTSGGSGPGVVNQGSGLPPILKANVAHAGPVVAAARPIHLHATIPVEVKTDGKVLHSAVFKIERQLHEA